MDDIDRAIEDLRALLAEGITRWADGQFVSVKLAELLIGRSAVVMREIQSGREVAAPLIDGCRIVHRGDGFDVCKIHYRYWRTGSEMCPGRQAGR